MSHTTAAGVSKVQLDLGIVDPNTPAIEHVGLYLHGTFLDLDCSQINGVPSILLNTLEMPSAP
jgi:hypothetical protein